MNMKAIGDQQIVRNTFTDLCYIKMMQCHSDISIIYSYTANIFNKRKKSKVACYTTNIVDWREKIECCIAQKGL